MSSANDLRWCVTRHSLSFTCLHQEATSDNALVEQRNLLHDESSRSLDNLSLTFLLYWYHDESRCELKEQTKWSSCFDDSSNTRSEEPFFISSLQHIPTTFHFLEDHSEPKRDTCGLTHHSGKLGITLHQHQYLSTCASKLLPLYESEDCSWELIPSAFQIQHRN